MILEEKKFAPNTKRFFHSYFIYQIMLFDCDILYVFIRDKIIYIFHLHAVDNHIIEYDNLDGTYFIKTLQKRWILPYSNKNDIPKNNIFKSPAGLLIIL